MATLEHKNIPDTELHPPARVAASDPGAIGAGRGWIDTSGSPYLLKIRNGTNTGWDTIGATGGGIAIGDAVGSGTSGSVLFVDSSGNLAQDNSVLNFNASTDVLRITGELSVNKDSSNIFVRDVTGTITCGYIGRNTSNNGVFINADLGTATLATGGSAAEVELRSRNTDGLKVDYDATADNTRLLLYDVTAGTFKRVSRGASDSGGTGFRVLRIPN